MKNDELVDRIKEKFPSWRQQGDDLRLMGCPVCGAQHPSNPAFSIQVQTGKFYCHDCEKGGHISELLTNRAITKTPTIQNKINTPENLEPKRKYDSFSKSTPGSLTDQYLQHRGIITKTWLDLTHPLKEAADSSASITMVYPFVDDSHQICAIQRTFINTASLTRTQRMYLGLKGTGVAILKDTPKVIIAEGLETGLSVRQHLGNTFGLIVCGDAGNLAHLADTHAWCLEARQEIIIAADNDVNNSGINAARQVYFAFERIATIYMPSAPGKDWNDILVQGRMEKEWI